MKPINFFGKQKIRYLLAGAWNTIFGYTLGVFAYLSLGDHMHIIFISILVNIIAITMSFLSYKLFVFKTPGKWFMEYLKIYLVYGGTALIGTFLLWGFVDYFKISIWISQGLVLGLLFIISFILNKNFTFKRS
jgi:putative flippase GtrA